MARTTVKTYTAEELVAAFLAMLENGTDAAPAKKGRAAKEEPEDDEEDEDDEEGEVDVPDEETVRAMGIKDLRALAVALGLDEQKVKSGILDEMDEKGLFGDSDEEGEEEDDEDEDEDEEEGYSREELEEMTLPQVRKIAKEEYELTIPRGSDQDTIIDMILGEDEEDEEDDEEEEEEGEGEDDETTLSEDDLKAMDLAGLQELASELEIKVRVPKTAKTSAAKKKVYVEAILDTADDDE